MEIKSVDSYRIDIHIAGDLAIIKQVCREYYLRVGLCVTIQEQLFIYASGEESGVRVGLLNYPRFPSPPDELLAMALDLADLLLERTCQLSVLLEAPDRTEWRNRRADIPVKR